MIDQVEITVYSRNLVASSAVTPTAIKSVPGILQSTVDQLIRDIKRAHLKPIREELEKKYIDPYTFEVMDPVDYIMILLEESEALDKLLHPNS